MSGEPMGKDEIRRILQEVFRTVFDDSELQIFDAMTAKDVAQWDSLNHLALVIAVQKRFSVSLTTKEVLALKNVGEFLDVLQGKLAR